MKDQYAGDIGDYIKLALLRAVAPGRRLGVVWYRTPDDGGSDGRRIGYLEQPQKWRHFDPELFDCLACMVREGHRSIAALEEALKGDVTFFDAMLTGPAARTDWFTQARDKMSDRDLIFVDPDNGVAPAGYRPRSAKSVKSITLYEISELHQEQRPVIVYHHQSMFKGGHILEIDSLGEQLKLPDVWDIFALRAKPGSARAFFFVDPDRNLRNLATDFASRWQEHVDLRQINNWPLPLNLPDESPYSERALRREHEFFKAAMRGEYDEIFGPVSTGLLTRKPGITR